MVEKLELLQQVHIAERQIAEGEILTNAQVKKRLSDRYKK